MRPIDADRLSFILQKNFCYADAVEVIQQLIDAQPTLDVAPVVHAHWVIVPLSESTTENDHCSNCGTDYPYIDDYPGKRAHFPPYCPCCGAKMDKEI